MRKREKWQNRKAEILRLQKDGYQPKPQFKRAVVK
jgi:hypothetical protein